MGSTRCLTKAVAKRAFTPRWVPAPHRWPLWRPWPARWPAGFPRGRAPGSGGSTPASAYLPKKEYQSLFTETQVAILSEFMRETVEAGTASRLNKDAYTAYGKTGTAQTTNDLDKTNAWFVGYAEHEGKEIAIAVVVENSGTGSAYAVPIAEKVFDLYFK